VCEQLTPERLSGFDEPGTIGHGSPRTSASFPQHTPDTKRAGG
jgi:hypothetical protein